MDKYRPCPSIIAMFTSDSQHPPRSRHAVYLGVSYHILVATCSPALIAQSHGSKTSYKCMIRNIEILF